MAKTHLVPRFISIQWINDNTHSFLFLYDIVLLWMELSSYSPQNKNKYILIWLPVWKIINTTKTFSGNTFQNNWYTGLLQTVWVYIQFHIFVQNNLLVKQSMSKLETEQQRFGMSEQSELSTFWSSNFPGFPFGSLL